MAGMTKESIQLKNVKIAWNMSEETTAFTATLYIDGAKAAYVKNEGTGGDNHPRFMDRKLETEFLKFCLSLPPEQFSDTTSVNGKGLTNCCDALTTFHDTEECCKVCWKEIQEPYPMTYDSFIGNLLTEWISNDDWKKACKKGVVYTLTSHKDGEYMLWKVPYSPTMAERVRKQYSETGNLKEIINERFI